MMPNEIWKDKMTEYMYNLKNESIQDINIDTNQDQLDEKASLGQGTSHLSIQIPTEINLH
jgi:hypothetical protein